jgi:hypothetical protein
MNTDTFIEYSIQDDTLIVPTNEVASGLEFGEYVVNSLDSYTNPFRRIDEPIQAVQNSKRIATELAPDMTPVRVASMKNPPAFGSVVLNEKGGNTIEAKYRGNYDGGNSRYLRKDHLKTKRSISEGPFWCIRYPGIRYS